MKTHHKIIKTIIATAILSSGTTIYNTALAQDTNPGGNVTTQISTSIVPPPNYSNGDLIGAGCSPNVWNKMVSDYTRKATVNTEFRNQIQVRNQGIGAPTPDQVGRCFDAAARTINNATRAFNMITRILNGSFDSGALYDYAEKIAVNAACSQINSYVSQSGLNTTINGGVGAVNGGLGTILNSGNQIGGVNVGSAGQILGAGGLNQGGNNIPYVNGNAVGGAINTTLPYMNPNTPVSTTPNGSGITGIISNLNPFR